MYGSKFGKCMGQFSFSPRHILTKSTAPPGFYTTHESNKYLVQRQIGDQTINSPVRICKYRHASHKFHAHTLIVRTAVRRTFTLKRKRLFVRMDKYEQVCASTHKWPIGESEVGFLHSALLPRGTFCMQTSA